ncbi:MAG: protein-glutamate O-methyltransferase CheR [Sedimenticola sp.]
MTGEDIERIEIDLLLEGIYQTYGYDFRSYARASVDRRVRQFAAKSGIEKISEMIPRTIHDKEFFSKLAHYFSVSVTEMFRDPFVFLEIRHEVLPSLHSYPFFKVWHAGCATGEEVYSLAILLQEEKLLERATIYATDFNEEVLEQARKGIYPLSRMKDYTSNYQEAGGSRSFSEYYHARYDSAAISDNLKRRITFACHNLAADGVFGEIHLVFCRNLLIYFNRDLQNRALGLFTDSLVRGGYLCLGTSESLEFSDVKRCYELVDKKAKIYRKVR